MAWRQSSGEQSAARPSRAQWTSGQAAQTGKAADQRRAPVRLRDVVAEAQRWFPGSVTMKATVQVEDGVKYGDLIRILDACNLKDASNHPILFPEVSISAAL